MRELRGIGPLLQMGWVVALSVLIPLGIGVWLDRRYGTAPLFILVAALVGIVASTVSAVHFGVRAIEAAGKRSEHQSQVDTTESEKENAA